MEPTTQILEADVGPRTFNNHNNSGGIFYNSMGHMVHGDHAQFNTFYITPSPAFGPNMVLEPPRVSFSMRTRPFDASSIGDVATAPIPVVNFSVSSQFATRSLVNISVIAELMDLLMKTPALNRSNTLRKRIASLQQITELVALVVKAYARTPLAIPLDDHVVVLVEHCRLILREILKDLSRHRHAISAAMIRLVRRYIRSSIREPKVFSAADSKLQECHSSLASCILALGRAMWPEMERASEEDWVAIIQFYSLLERDAPFLSRIKMDTVTVVDHLARDLPIPVMFCNSFENFHIVLTGFCRYVVGNENVKRGEYRILQQADDQVIDRSQFSAVLLPGVTVEMSIVLLEKVQSHEQHDCPKCKHKNNKYTTASGNEHAGGIEAPDQRLFFRRISRRIPSGPSLQPEFDETSSIASPPTPVEKPAASEDTPQEIYGTPITAKPAKSLATTIPEPTFSTEHSSVINDDLGKLFADTPSAPHALELLRALDPVTMNTTSRPRCLPGTRNDILQSLTRDLTESSTERNVIWLSGLAGSGKSTVSTTIAERLRMVGQMGAFLFFDRNFPAQNGPDGVIRTIAYQLALFNPTLGGAICDVVERDPQIGTRTLITQFNDLIKSPLNSCNHQVTGPVVIILDAFDECGDAKARRALIQLLVKELPLLPHQFRFLITSRPEFDLHSFQSQEAIKAISLSSSEWASAPDVLLYIKHEMNEYCRTRRLIDHLPRGWPGMSVIRELGARAGDSFIWAAAAMRYLHDAADVVEYLRFLLAREAFTLGDLYATMLRAACEWYPGKTSTENCRKILGAVVVGRIAITDDTVVDILGLESAKSCRLILRKLRCLLQWSEGLPIRVFHTTFADYLTDSASCGDQPWYIDVAQHHLDFTAGCLLNMKRLLHFNICKLETSHRTNSDVEDLSERIERFIPVGLAYACRFWAEHLTLARRNDNQILTLMVEFFKTLFLYWLEVVSLLGEGYAALQSMVYVEAYSRDGIKFVKAFMSIIMDSAPHIYISALPFAPSRSIIKQQYTHIVQNTLFVHHAETTDWPHSDEMPEHSDHSSAHPVAFTSDGEPIISSSMDETIHIHPTGAATSLVSGEGLDPSIQLLNGWMQKSPTELLFWVPPAYRRGLRWPSSIMNDQRSVELDLTKFAHGDDWVRCHN
ncbi:hypothetical protein HWV62_9909 [Athelia sp. TMB]|nr:hypothetical protein HWV62_9909 [Athelia sp. TMB]